MQMQECLDIRKGMLNFKMAIDYDCSGWATKANTRCYDGLTIAPDAFKECDGKTVPMVYNHDHSSVDNVIGHCLLKTGPRAYTATPSSTIRTPAGRPRPAWRTAT